MSLFSDYIEEIDCGRHIFEIAGKGFVTWIIHDHGECYIEDMYVSPEFRSSGVFSLLLGHVELKAMENKCEIISHGVNRNNKSKDVVLKLTKAKGYRKYSENEFEENFIKELR